MMRRYVDMRRKYGRLELRPKPMMSGEKTIYVRLLNEGTDVWRPVRALHIEEDRYHIVERP